MIDERADGCPPQFKRLGEFGLRGAIQPQDVDQCAPLRSRQSDRIHLFVECGAKRPCDLFGEKTQINAQIARQGERVDSGIPRQIYSPSCNLRYLYGNIQYGLQIRTILIHKGKHMRLQTEGSSPVALAVDVLGPLSGPPVIFAHGGGQTRHAWRSVCATLASVGFLSFSYDLRGHGESDWASDGDYSLEIFCRDLQALCGYVAATSGRAPHIVGASLGGLIAIATARNATGGETFKSLTLVDIAPELDEAGVARIIGFMGANLQDGFASLEEAADAVARYLPHRPRSRNPDGLRKNLRRSEDGRWRWHWDPVMIEKVWQRSSPETKERLNRALSAIKAPIQLVRGGSSEIVTLASVEAFLKLAPHAQFTDVAGARHMVAGDDNDCFSQAVIDFLQRTEAEDAT